MIVEVLVTVFFLVVTLICLFHNYMFMSNAAHVLLMVFQAGLFAMFALLTIKQKAADERDKIHMMIAGQSSYIVGIGALVTAICYQAFTEQIDPWLIGILAVMLLTKVVVRIYAHNRM
jgi:predicted MFS family arabinose efflux permease